MILDENTAKRKDERKNNKNNKSGNNNRNKNTKPKKQGLNLSGLSKFMR